MSTFLTKEMLVCDTVYTLYNPPIPKSTIVQKWWHLMLGWVIFWLFPRRRVSVSLNWLPTWNNQHFYSPDPVDSSTCHFTLSGKNLMVSWSQLLLTAVRFWHLHLLLQVYRWKFKAIWKMVLSYKGDPAMEVPGKFPHNNYGYMETIHFYMKCGEYTRQ